MSISPRQILVSCEHASNRLPGGPDFELDPRLLDLHIAYDPGAETISRRIAAHFDAPLHLGKHTRLLVDLNRSVDNRQLIRRVSDGHRVPFNYGLSAAARAARVERYWRPYRDAVSAGVDAIVAREGRCVHLCVHTYTPALAGRVRGNDIGLLFDPRYGIERRVASELREELTSHTDLVVWFNRPYSGTADGILPALRRPRDPSTFVGIELEINQSYAGDRAALLRIADQIVAALRATTSLFASSAT